MALRGVGGGQIQGDVPATAEALAASLGDVALDPDAWAGAAAGAAAVLAVVTWLCIRGRLCWVCSEPSMRSMTRSLSTTYETETWYDALEDHFPSTTGVIDYASRAVPLLWGEDAGGDPPVCAGASAGAKPRLRQLLGTSVPRRSPEEVVELPRDEVGRFERAYWSPGDASEVKVRQGPDYPRTGAKDESRPALYECVGMDVVSAGCRIEEAMPRLGPLPTGGAAAGWHGGCGVPRCLFVNCLLPLQEGPKLWGEHPPDDHGVSVVLQFTATAALVKAAEAEARSGTAADRSTNGPEDEVDGLRPAVRLLQKLFQRGTLDGDGRSGFYSSCALKAIGWVEDLEKVELPRMLRPTVERYNGKPVLLTTFGKMSADPNGEWMEIDFDVRAFSWPTRSSLCKLRDRFRQVSVHVAFVVQGTQDDELPEVVLGNLRIHGLDLEADSFIDDPRASSG